MKNTIQYLALLIVVVATAVRAHSGEPPGPCPAAPAPGHPPMEVLAEKQFPGAVKCLARASSNDSLLILDQTFLFDLDTKSMKRQVIPFREEKEQLANYWNPKNFAVSADGSRLLIVDKVIDTRKRRVDRVLDVRSAITSGNPNPEALDISRDGNLGLVMVRSFSSDKFDALALFDLATGDLKHARQKANQIRHAIFGAGNQLIVFYKSGRIALEEFDGTQIASLSDKGPVPLPWGNHAMIFSTTANRWLAVSDGKEIAVFDLDDHTRRLKDTCAGGLAVDPDTGRLFYQGIRSSGKRCGCGKHDLMEVVLKERNLETDAASEVVLSGLFQPMLVHTSRKHLWVVDFDKLQLLRLP